MRATKNPGIIEVRVRELTQLFDAMDPAPFRERDVSPHAEEYIVDSVKELPSGVPYELVIHLGRASGSSGEDGMVGDAIRVHFARRAKLLRRDLRALMRRGAISLVIGLAFLATFFAVAHLFARLLGERPLTTLLREGLMIVGWVAMWRPLEIFLYSWWPILGEQRIHERLSCAHVRIAYDGGSFPGQPDQPHSAAAAGNPIAHLQVILPAQAPAQSGKDADRAVARWENEGGRVTTSAAARASATR